MKKGPGEWKPADATKRINECASCSNLTLTLTFHAKERMRERNLILADVRHVLERGFVYVAPERASRDGYFKYKIEGTSPNSDGRTVRVVVIPDDGPALKVVTVMWRDEE